MADPTQGGGSGVVGGVEVEVRARLDRLEADLSRAQARLTQFDTTASASMTRVDTAANAAARGLANLAQNTQRAEATARRLDQSFSGIMTGVAAGAQAASRDLNMVAQAELTAAANAARLAGATDATAASVANAAAASRSFARELRSIEREFVALGSVGSGVEALQAETFLQASRAAIRYARDLDVVSARQAEVMRQLRMPAGAAAIDTRIAQQSQSGIPTGERAADIEAYGKALDDTRAKFVPLFAAQQSYRKNLGDIRQALAVGAINQREYGEAITNAKVAFIQKVNALRPGRDALVATGAAMGVTRREAAGAADSVKMLAREIVAMSTVMAPVPAGLTLIAGGLGRMGVAGLAAGAALVVVGGAVAKSLVEWARAEQIMLTTEAVIKATGGAAGKTADDIANLSREIGYATLATDEEVQSAANLLLTFRSISGASFDRALRSAQDLATVGLGSINSAARQVAAALEDPERGLTALRRAGVQFSEAQKLVIKDLVETGRSAEAAEIILARIEATTKGAGVAAAEGLAGAFDKLTEATGNWFELAGQAIDRSFSLSTRMKAIADRINSSLLTVEKGQTPEIRNAAAVERLERVKTGLEGFKVFSVGGVEFKIATHSAEDLARAMADVVSTGNALEDAQIGAAIMDIDRAAAAAAKTLEDLDDKVAAVGISTAREIELLRRSNSEREIDRRLRSIGLGAEADFVGPRTAQQDATAAARRAATESIQDLVRAQQELTRAGTIADFMGAAVSPTQQLDAAMEALNRKIRENDELWKQLTPSQREAARAAAQLAVEIDVAGKKLAALGPLATVAEQVAQKVREIKFSGLSEADQRRVAEFTRLTAMGVIAMREQADALRIEAATLGMSTAAATEYRVVLEKVLEFRRRMGQEPPASHVEEWRREARGIGEVAEALERVRVTREIAFQAKTLFLSEQDLRIAQQLRSLYGEDLPRALGSSEAAALRLVDNLKLARDLTGDFVTGVVADLRRELAECVPLMEAFTNALSRAFGRLADRLIDMGLRSLVNDMFAGGTKLLGLNLPGLGGGLTARGATPANPMFVSVVPGGLPLAPATATAASGLPGAGASVASTTVGAGGLPTVSSPSIAPSLPTPAVGGLPSIASLPPVSTSPLGTSAGVPFPVPRPGMSFADRWSGITAPDTVTFQGGQPNLDFTNTPAPHIDFGGAFKGLQTGTIPGAQTGFGDVTFGRPWGGGGTLTPDQLLRTPQATQGFFGGAPTAAGFPAAPPVLGAEGIPGAGAAAGGGGFGGGFTGMGGLGSSFSGGGLLGGALGGGEGGGAALAGGFTGGGGPDFAGTFGSFKEVEGLKDAFSSSTDAVTTFTDQLTTGTDQFTTQMTTAVGSAAKFGTGLDIGGTKLTGFADGAVQQSTAAMATTATQTTTMGTAAVTTSAQVQQLGTASQTASTQVGTGGAGGFGNLFSGFFAGGGPIKGSAGPTSDRTIVAASPGEYLINAESARKHRALVELINTDRLDSILMGLPRARAVPDLALPRMARGGPVDEGVRPAMTRQYIPTLAADAASAGAGRAGGEPGRLGTEASRGAVTVDAKIVNAIDGTSFLNEALATREGQRVIVNYMSANRSTVRRALGV